MDINIRQIGGSVSGDWPTCWKIMPTPDLNIVKMKGLDIAMAAGNVGLAGANALDRPVRMVLAVDIKFGRFGNNIDCSGWLIMKKRAFRYLYGNDEYKKKRNLRNNNSVEQNDIPDETNWGCLILLLIFCPPIGFIMLMFSSLSYLIKRPKLFIGVVFLSFLLSCCELLKG